MSETMIRVSYGTAIVLGLIKARQDVAPTTAYLLYDKGCIGSCSFCPRSNGNEKSQKLSRIIWPEFDLQTVIKLLSAEPKPFERVCLQTGYNPAQTEQLKKIVKHILSAGISTSMTLNPSQTELAMEMLKTGLDHIGIGLDAASSETYKKHKHKNWETDWLSLKNLMNNAKEKIEVHQIFGLGDTEEVFMNRIQQIVDAEGKVSLFALTPVNGGEQPDIQAYRRVQAFRFMCENKIIRIDSCIFSESRLTSFDMTMDDLVKSLQNGDAFRTSGCGSCNRPYYNERPGRQFYNYPRPLSQYEFEKAIHIMNL